MRAWPLGDRFSDAKERALTSIRDTSTARSGVGVLDGNMVSVPLRARSWQDLVAVLMPFLGVILTAVLVIAVFAAGYIVFLSDMMSSKHGQDEAQERNEQCRDDSDGPEHDAGSEEKHDHRGVNGTLPESQEQRAARILGLRGSVTRDNIKKAYRDLVSQYHPDKVSHLGPKLKAVAEKEMKEINEAYSYFKAQYRL